MTRDPSRRPPSTLRLAAAFALACLPAWSGAAFAAPPPPVSVADASDDGIPWFPGSVEEAFAKARAERRPVFLYWGAVWCPPCHALRTKLFSRPEFRSRLAATVPVYLDGDTERAQIWGEKLGTQGYPTVIVFDADGREVTRIFSLLPGAQYAEVLGRALDATRPIAEVLAAAEADGPASLPPAELNLLAFHAWDQDPQLDLEPERRRTLAGRLWRETPDTRVVERARFLALYLQTLSAHDETDSAPSVPAEERASVVAELRRLLSDPERRDTNLDLVLYAAADTVRLVVPDPGAERDALVAAWNAAARAVEDDSALSTDDRLTALLPQLALAQLDPPAGSPAAAAVPAALRDRVRERVRWAGETVRGEDEMQAVMSSMAGLLEEAGLADEAESLLSDELSRTRAPYYYVGWMAALEAKAGHGPEAVALYRKAWQGARQTGGGAAMTPFRWGSRYLREATKRTPDALAAIAADAHAVLAELLASPDAFAGGNWSRLQGLGEALAAWRGDAAGRAAVVEAVRSQVHAACGRFVPDAPGSARERCDSFLATPAD